MKLSKWAELDQFFKNGLSDTEIKKWVSQDDHEDIILKDAKGNLYNIKFYPSESKE